MNIIQTQPNPSGSRPGIQSWSAAAPPAGYSEVAPGVDTSAMQTHNGFVTLSITSEVVTALEPNIEAWEAWKASLPEPVPPTPTAQEDADALLIDHEYRLTLLELGVNDNAV